MLVCIQANTWKVTHLSVHCMFRSWAWEYRQTCFWKKILVMHVIKIFKIVLDDISSIAGNNREHCIKSILKNTFRYKYCTYNCKWNY
jgi:hypothetical protein